MNIKTNKHQYIEQIGCHICKHCFVVGHYDSGPEYYCNLDNDRPKCGSVAMGKSEKFDYDAGDYEKWSEWAKTNAVEPWGICKKWEETTYEEECALQGVEP